ncbi:MAG: ATP-binding cassette domain-containing protein, partial [Candidatus Binatia bacterium]
MIQLNNLTKRYGKLAAVDGLDLEVPAGQIFGFLGPNGAGKTTTI